MLVWGPPGAVMLVSISLNVHKVTALKYYAFFFNPREKFSCLQSVFEKENGAGVLSNALLVTW